MKKTIIASTITALMGATIATPAMANTYDDHNYLINAVKSTGVYFYINPNECDTVKAAGWFQTFRDGSQAMVICQDNKVTGSTRQVQWTANDLDTIRHEAHHLTQDCINGRRDGDLGAVYKRPIELGYRVLGQAKTNWVAENYAEMGASGHIQVMEIEAFAVAQMNDPIDQANDIRRFCF